jgi:hypothetical protein
MKRPAELLEDLSRQTWDRIRDGHSLSIRQGESAITDTLLLEIARASLPSMKILKTSQAEECSKGTDWEWWVGSRRHGWLRYAIQAKKIFFPRDTYQMLGHKVGSRLQVDVLLDYATANQAVALYCLYNATDAPDVDRYWHCTLKFERKQLGCTLAPAETIKRCLSMRGKRTFKGVHSDLRVLPWRCIVKCPAILDAYSRRSSNASKKVRLPFLNENELATIHPSLPTGLEGAMETGRVDKLDEEFFRGNPEYFPRYLAIIDVTENL